MHMRVCAWYIGVVSGTAMVPFSCLLETSEGRIDNGIVSDALPDTHTHVPHDIHYGTPLPHLKDERPNMWLLARRSRYDR
ncbi:uncharacterized protein B0T23DRAFT_383977 [Neurospora hispaniola]|uniref:Secreted protein n=1 Tax=Neurospora hispaniola TaxID=588809 RepID=A0AAJ0MP28_9PEZI|nr:hypothetical protein B0T23DRAFT_383977 [Neurospora hispaniola]